MKSDKGGAIMIVVYIMRIRDAKKLAEILNISESEQIVSVISVGYRAIEPQKPKRKSVEEIAKFY